VSGKITQNSEKTANTPALTAREQEIMDLLLSGVIPKEIANTLNISYATVLDHQKNLYRKLDVHNINELFVKHSKANGTTQTENVNPNMPGKTSILNKVKFKSPKILIPAGIIAAAFIILILFLFMLNEKGIAAVFTRLDIFYDDFGSHITLTPNIEKIQDNYTETYTISGHLSQRDSSYTGIIAIPDPSTQKIMKKMKRFSFTVLGDGKTYMALLPTTEARQEGGSNFYGVFFTTKNGVISTFTFLIDQLSQSSFFGKKVPFVQDNIEAFQIQIWTKGDFNLKFWDIKFHL